MANIQNEITDADLSRAASQGARVLTPKVVMDLLGEFDAKTTAHLKGQARHDFIDRLNAAITNVKNGKPIEIVGTAGAPPESARKLIERYGLTWDYREGLCGGAEYLFVVVSHDDDVVPPLTLPRITHADKIYFLIPAGTDMSEHEYLFKCAVTRVPRDVACEGAAFIREAEGWPIDSEIIKIINGHNSAASNACDIRDAKALLASEREASAGLYASAAPIAEITPMLIEGLMRESGVSVIYGDFDEFKTTLVLDMAAHVAAGAPWQGRKVMARPVVWYALEGSDDIPVRLCALEASFRGKDTPWGDDRLPITVIDRIPEDYRQWRAEISSVAERWEHIYSARERTGEMPKETVEYRTADGTKGTYEKVHYPEIGVFEGSCPVVVIDTLSMALGGEDEKGAGAVGFIGNCLDLLKERPDMAAPAYKDEIEEWEKQHPGETQTMDYPVASHVIIIHHQTKTGTEFAGHRAIAANTQGLYRVHRFGKITDSHRAFAGMLTTRRTKDMPRPAPVRFDVDVVPVAGTQRSALILKDRATAIPKELTPVIEAFRELENPEVISSADLNECLDVEAAKGAKDGPAKRKARQRCREKLEAAGVIEPVEDDNGNVSYYRFHDVTAA